MNPLRKITLGCLAISFLLWTGCQNSGEETNATDEQETESTEQTSPGTVSDADLLQFTNAMMAIQDIQNQGQSQMLQVLEEEGMDVQKFNEIMQKKSNPMDTTALPAEDEAQFNKIDARLQEIEMNLNAQSEAAIEEAGMSVEDYQGILAEIQQDTTLQRKVQELMMGS